jgi:hypothetical protein
VSTSSELSVLSTYNGLMEHPSFYLCRSTSTIVPRKVELLTTCPFCHQAMPLKKSRQLMHIMQPWLDRYHAKYSLSATSTLEACQMHRNESKTIPEGRAKGWSKTLNEDRLRTRVKNEKNPFMSIMRQRIKDPLSSAWFAEIIESRRLHGRQMENSKTEMMDMEEQQAG